MKLICRNAMIVSAAIVIGLVAISCTPENTLVKRDYRNASAGDTGFDEETNDFGDTDGDRKWSNKKNRNGDSSISDEGDSSYKKDKFYQTGMASWYGREFQGKKTASGEKFNMNDLTAAHKSLPFGTVVKVKNFENGKTVSVRINDRGPYRGNRIIDLSYGAAKKLGMLKDGKTQVGIKILKNGSGKEGTDEYEDENDGGRDGDLEAVSGDSDNDTGNSGGSALQVGAFYSKRNAENLKSKVEGMTNKSVVIIHDRDMYKVRVEGISSERDLSRLKKSLSEEDIPSYMVNKNE